jgi:pimeloyl-ACP methyl ester carboxylesterase
VRWATGWPRSPRSPVRPSTTSGGGCRTVAPPASAAGCVGWRTVAERPFRRYLRDVEGLSPEQQPGPTLARDGANGVELYRRNVRPRIADPQERTTDVPVLLVVPIGDRYVSPAMAGEAARHCSDLRQVEVDARHWLPAAHPDVTAALVREHVAARG